MSHLHSRDGRVEDVGAIEVMWARGMRDVLGDGVLAAYLGDAGVRGFAGFGEGVVAAVEVFAFLDPTCERGGRVEKSQTCLELVLKEVVPVGEFAVEPEEPLLFGGHGLS